MQTVEITARTLQDATQQAADKLGVTPNDIKVTVIEETKGLFGKSTVRVRGELVSASPAAKPTSESASPAVSIPATPAPAAKSPRAKRVVGKVAVEEPAAETHPVAEVPVEETPKSDGARRRRKPAEPTVVADGAAETGEAPPAAEDVVASREDAETLVGIVRGLLDAAQLAVTADIGSMSGRYVNIVLDGRDVSFIVGKHGDVLNAMQYLVNIISSRRIERGVRATLDGNDYRRRREEALTTLAQRIAEQVRLRGEEAVLDALPAFERRIVHKALGEITGVTTYSEGEEPNRRVVIAPE